MIRINELNLNYIESFTHILVDTRAYRISGTTWDNSISMDEVLNNETVLKPKIVLESPDNYTSLQESILTEQEVLDFINNLYNLTNPNPMFYFKHSIIVKNNDINVGFWPFKYLNFWRKDENTFTLRTSDFLNIDWKSCNKENLVLNEVYGEEIRKNI